MLVKIFDLDECEELDNRRFVLKKDLSNAFSLYLRGKFSEIVSAELEVEAKLTYQLNRKSGMPEKILQALGKDNLHEVQQKYQNPVGVLYKVELADVPIAALMGELPKLLEQLLKNNCFLLDLDITQDFGGIFNKSIMCDFLTTNHCFCLKGKLKEDYNVISDDNKEVGIDCLTWVGNNNNVRVKFYNKFICQMTSLETNKLLGNDVINFIVCPDSRLRKTFASNLAKMHGVTRLEAKVCNYSLEKKSPSKTFDPIQDSLLLMNDIENYFRKAPLFSVSLSKMWTKLSDTLKNSCCLVYNNLLQYVYWGNSHTKKLTGVQVKLPTNPEQKDVMISYAIRAFSFNSLPINYVEIGEDTNNRDNIIFTKKRFIKSGETYFSKSTTLFSTIDLKVNLDELGLVRTKNIIPQVLRKKTNIDSKVSLYLIEEIEPLFPIRVPELTPNSVTGPSSRKRKVEYDEIHGKRRKLELMECTEYIIEQEPYRQPIDFQNEMKYLIEQFEKSKLE